MQKLAEVCIQRPVFAVMLILALVVVGGVSYTKLGVDRFPNVDLPIVSVRTILPGASPEEIESTITKRVEDAVATVEGIDLMRATSTESTSILTVTFNLKRDIDVAAQDVRDAVATEGTPVRVRDIGYAADGNKEQRTAARYDGKPAVSLLVQRQSGANSIAVINGIKDRLQRIRQMLPAGVTLEVVQDQSRYIE